jgi:diacylglycerol O-acyltransferase
MQRAVSMHSERLSLADQAWLRMDAPTNPMVITAFVTFAERVTMPDLRDFVSEHLLPSPRFRQRLAPATPLHGPRWEPTGDFDLRGHLHHVALPDLGDDRALADMIGDLMSAPLDARLPLWQIHLVDSRGGGSALVIRLHHAIADGVALVRLLHSMTGVSPAIPSGAVRDGPGTIRLAQVLPATLAVARLLLLKADPRTPLKHELGTIKRAAWSRPASLSKLKSVAHRHDATVNDVFATVVAGGLRRHLQRCGTVGPDLEVRAVVPVNLRKRDDAARLGNRFGLVFLALPLGIASPVDRLRQVVARTHELKDGVEAGATFGVLEGMALVTPGADAIVMDVFEAKATLVLTSVAGPSSRISIAGRPVRSMGFFAPQAAGLGLGVSLLSYLDEVRIGVASDANVSADPAEIVAGIEAELAALGLEEAPPPGRSGAA